MYSAIGSINTTIRPFLYASFTAVLSIRTASAPFEGIAKTKPGISLNIVKELSLWKCPPKPF